MATIKKNVGLSKDHIKWLDHNKERTGVDGNSQIRILIQRELEKDKTFKK